MTDLPSEIFKKYGMLAILFAFIAAFSIWFIAHWAASPGKEVTVLWGLVKYTKASGGLLRTTPMPETNIFSSNEDKKDTEILPNITIYAQNIIKTELVDEMLIELREERRLRELTALESGKKVSELPKGTFFFIDSYLRSSEFQSVQSEVLESKAERFRLKKSRVEIHNTLAEGLHVIGFMSESDASEISQLTGNKIHDIIFSPYPWGQLTTLVSMPLGRIYSIRSRDIQVTQDSNVEVFDTSVK